MLTEKELEVIRRYALILNMSEDELEKVIYTFKNISTTVIDLWNEIKDAFYGVNEIIESIEWDERIRDSWHVPQKITRNHQVIDRKPLFARIRNNI